ncbi:MAG TPA: hypothetical protein VKS99_17490 [Blastocatellia bacterium]|nr:hypothetical protein [Blastocatellia bacterium]
MIRSLPFRFLLPFAFLTLAGIAAGATAQSPDKILKQAVKALGGESAVRRITMREAKGAIRRTTDNAQGSLQMLTLKPDLYLLTFDIGGIDVSEGFNGKSAWRRDSRAGLRTLTGVESLSLRAATNFRNHLWLNYKKEKSKLIDAGQETVGGKPARAVMLTTRENVKIKLWFDTASGLPVREEMPAGNGVTTFEYSNYSAVDGVLEPFTIKLNTGGEQYNITLSDVTHNPPLDRARFDFRRISAEPLPDVSALIKEVSAHQEEIERIQERYACAAVVTLRETDKRGGWRDKETKTYDVSFYRGRQIMRLAAKNDQPLSAQDQAEEDRRVEKLIHEIDKREAEGNQASGVRKMGPPDPAARAQAISAILRTSRLANPRRESYGGREVIVFDFEPQPGYKPTTTAEKFLSKSSGVMWIDAAARQIVRVDVRLDDSISIGGGLIGSVKAGAKFIREQGLVSSNEGEELWLPTYAEIDIPVRALFVGITINSMTRYGGYRRFDVNAEKEKLKAPEKR